MQNNNKRADCGSPNSLAGAAETAAPPDKKASQVKTCEAFKMALQDGLEPTTP